MRPPKLMLQKPHKVNMMVIQTTPVDCLLCQLNGCQFIYILLSLKYTTRFLPWFSTDLQSGEAEISCQRSKPVCRFELTDLIENHVVYDLKSVYELFT